ncbi:DsbE family thiol:disulfide interchange protein [Polynucleobacter asymbioticus]|jgi:cytochrome c biogenesis protein CcmG/thiol:disulfide interchange protein DsbE|uniref:Periplasmic protein thiol--disulfide oxidoreductase DsbE n=2 Tax=Polynucleobacter asymbioticus TaxID=576611 RepID=A4SZ12_POLAQ|nr:DsbE family thiol:disulfide interchange protein [Polynucleobacter asymbioticus]ABP34726.1 periplasmic protein thiol--disulfide oxidoreductase DsbE [Polynucleobacter asymbioticus QLW-P1DMWA-1]APB99399.1 thiol:disulfide interchange protein [Polynucleobacter asymbioticus]APC01706.1 thiol:disulfide interchange protein [Polynucleobacter asymbioticus]APC06554.1 thiol:disulfide interchange protein [Polynucleobacter asymbioticus]
MKLKFLIPLLLFVILVGFLAIGLNRDPHELPSPLIGKPAPAFQVPQLEQANKTFSPESLKGQVWILNVWASWCVACREEHPMLLQLSKAQIAPLIGLDYKDQRDDALAMLARQGNPYTLSAFDGNGRVGINYGVYGVPETYVIDKAGIIRFKQIGPITTEILHQKIYPLINELKKS